MNSPALLRRLTSVWATACLVLLASCASMKSPPPAPVMAVESGPITSGLRSGSFAINNNSIDNLLAPGTTTPRKIDDRPGLGTTAGWERHSQLQSAKLYRKSSVPDVVDSFHYNDEAGAKTMVGILGGRTSKFSGLFAAAGERLKTGLIHYGDAYPRYEASGRRIVIGNAGQNYSVRLENRTKQRLEVVLSVDGLNVLNGKSASHSQRGFVLEPQETYDVDGFRKNDSIVKTFLFGRVADSHAAAQGKAGNVGVIGMAVFEEDEARAKAELQREQFVRENAQAFPVSR